MALRQNKLYTTPIKSKNLVIYVLTNTEMLVTDSWVCVIQYKVIVTFTLTGRGREQYVRKIIYEKRHVYLPPPRSFMTSHNSSLTTNEV